MPVLYEYFIQYYIHFMQKGFLIVNLYIGNGNSKRNFYLKLSQNFIPTFQFVMILIIDNDL